MYVFVFKMATNYLNKSLTDYVKLNKKLGTVLDKFDKLLFKLKNNLGDFRMLQSIRNLKRSYGGFIRTSNI